MNQPDLDFGFYRIMHARAEQVTRFLEDDLLAIVADSFGRIDERRRARFEAEYEKELKTAIEYGAIDPESVPMVREARARYETAQDTASAEGEIYDHLYRFFERYYDDGDFVSRRYYTRETPGKAAPFAVPYNGEEVKLHWANADQYYIKTAEHFRNFTVDLRQAKEVQEHFKANKLGLEVGDEAPRLVHFRIVDAAEGEHGNIKASESAKRYFVIHKDEPAVFTSEGELAIQFEYRPDPEKSGQEKTWRAKRNAQAVEIVLAALDDLAEGNEYKLLLTTPAPTEKEKERPLLAKYINQYTARNTMDYFIHKDLGAFLRRELDFYIKNEVMRLDDISTAEAPAVETYLSKLKALRTIAHKLIGFLAQLEDFQKRLWLKKKFVVETNYCITLDRIPEEFYPEIAANDAQREEWVRLFAIDEIEGSTVGPAYSNPLTVEFLKENTGFVLDTTLFPEAFVERLLSMIHNVSASTNGLLVHSENCQALRTLSPTYEGEISCIYIDPPYNTSENAFLYKNSYKHSSWISLLENSLLLSPRLLSRSGVFLGAIDDTEYANFKVLLNNVFGANNYAGTIVVEVNPAGQNIRPNVPARSHDYFHIYAKDIECAQMILRSLTDDEIKQYSERDSAGRFYWDNLRRRGGNSRPTDRPKQWFPLYAKGDDVRVPKMHWDNGNREWIVDEAPRTGEEEVWPVDPKGERRIWRVNPDGAKREIAAGEVAVIGKANRREVSKKSREPEGKKPKTLWAKSRYSATTYGTKLLLNLLGPSFHFSYPKSLYLTQDALKYWARENAVVLDYFAGSGTTGHAVIELNRIDNGNRRYVLVEMGDYFRSVLKPRTQKVIYSKTWKDGKPCDRQSGISHCFKYIRLESYEDCLNNLVFSKKKALDKTREGELEKNTPLREDYMLHYMLDVETRGSQSLLNIDAFADPTAYTLRVKKSGSDQYVTRNVDLIETFNYLIGLRVMHIAAPQTFNATFKRGTDPDLPEDTQTRLVLDGCLAQDENGPWWFRKVEGWVPADPNNPNNGERQKVLIVWRKLTGQIEEDNLMLNEWFQQNRSNTRDFEFDMIYVNGSNNLPILKQKGDDWKVRLIEEDFMRLMWDVEDV